MTFGDKYEWFVQLEQDGHVIPELEKKPDLYPDLQLDYHAFSMLSASRRIGMDVSPIPISEILAYAQYFHISDYTQRQVLLQRVRFLDRVFLDEHSRVRESKKDN